MAEAKKIKIRIVEDTKKKILSKIDSNRRNLLKLLIISIGALLVGKFILPIISFFSRSGLDTKKEFRNFQVIDESNEIIFRDIQGNDVLIVEKGAMK